MKDFILDMVNKLEDLYNMYENYMWRHEDSRLEVLIQDSTICFYMYKDKEVMDEIILQFDEADKGIYAYISIRLVIIMLGNVIIHVDDNVLRNPFHKPYLKVIVNDSGILDSICRIIKYQDKIIIRGDMEILEKVRSILPKIRYSKKFMKQFDERVSLSRKLLRKDN